MSRKFLAKALSRMVFGVVAAGAMVVAPSGAVAQQVCKTIEPEPPPDPSTFVAVPEVCFGGGAPGSTECTDDGCVIDVLVIYTPAARAAAGGTSDMNRFISLAESAHNTALSDSDVNVHIRVVMTYELDSNDLEDQPFTFVLACLGSKVCLPEVDDLRREVKADVLSLFVDVLDMPSIHGAAKIIGTYHVIEWLAAFRQPVWGFTHELGHNIGCRHQFLQDSCLQPFAYCHAYSRSSDPLFHTVVGFSPNENTILRYSNPDLLHSGVPMGDPATANNALCIKNSAQKLASTLIADCNGDGVCDIDEDCNGNGVPDPCDLDCGPAGGLCDVPNCGLAPDCNFNCVPDSCDLRAYPRNSPDA